MKRSYFAAATTATLLCLGGAILWGQQSVQQQPAAPAPGSRTVVVDRQVRGGQQQPEVRAPFQLSERMRGGARFGFISVVQEPDGTVTVKGSADIIDRRPVQYQYAWLLRVYSAENKKLLSEQHYLPSVLDEGETTASPGFVDNIDLKPGNYRVELSLYGNIPGFDVTQWKFGADVKRLAGITVSKSMKITVR
jgi:hypothetical protein